MNDRRIALLSLFVSWSAGATWRGPSGSRAEVPGAAFAAPVRALVAALHRPAVAGALRQASSVDTTRLRTLPHADPLVHGPRAAA